MPSLLLLSTITLAIIDTDFRDLKSIVKEVIEDGQASGILVKSVQWKLASCIGRTISADSVCVCMYAKIQCILIGGPYILKLPLTQRPEDQALIRWSVRSAVTESSSRMLF